MRICQELGISNITAVILLIVGYFVIKWAVKNGVKEAYKEIKNSDEKDVNVLNKLGDLCAEKKKEE